ncbi:unnamed protein product [Polarella glacialis]|uniref:Aspartyl/asparaginy/proline hydroxylase domain-containing protein n=1 Tax=Polarella glacialis TaxID=89957 RepID=A0A813L3V4_POLGL|nr:unnamed protein product [Polarella glacialis]
MSAQLADELWAKGVAEYLEGSSNPEQSRQGLSSFEASLDEDSTDSARHLFLATLRYVNGHESEALGSYEAAIASRPGCGHAYLELVLCLESKGRRDEARAVAQRAISAGARWSNEWQRPPIFSNGLTSRSWWGRDHFPWAADLESAFPQIKTELFQLLEAQGGGGPKMIPGGWPRVGEERASQDGDIVAPGGEWREFVIYGTQDSSKAVAEHLPQTCALLEDVLPGAVAMAKIGVGEIIFSALAPGTKLVPHCASSNVRLTCHLGMACPEGARLRVGNEWSSWEEGKCIFFDDSFEHEVVHEGDGLRIVLLIRFWHPELRADEWLPTLNAGMEEWSSMSERRSSPPVNAAVAQLLAAKNGQLKLPQQQHSAAALLNADSGDFAPVTLATCSTGLLPLTEVHDELD